MSFLKVTVVVLALSTHLYAEKSVWEAAQVKGSSGREVLDATVARVNGRNVYLSKLRQPQMDKEGALPTLPELLDKYVIMSRAENLSLIPSEADVQKQIEAFKAQFKAGAQGTENYDTAEQWLKAHGMSNQDLATFYREEISVNNVKHFYSVDAPLIPRGDIEAYYKAHPVMAEAAYHLKTAVLDVDQALDFDKLDHEKCDWIDLDFIPKSKISEEMSFVHNLEVGKASKPVKTPAGYQTVMVVEKKAEAPVPLVMRAPEIERILTKEALKKTMDLFMQDLKNNASLVVFKPL